MLPPITDHVTRTVTQIRIEVNRWFFAVMIFLIVVPPVLTGVLALVLPPISGLVIGVASGWIVGAAGAWIGFKAIGQVRTIDRA